MAGTSLNKGNKNALTVKLDQVYNLVEKGDNAGALEVLNGLVAQVGEFHSDGKLTDGRGGRAAPDREPAHLQPRILAVISS